MHDAVSNLAVTQSFHGQIRRREDNYIFIEERPLVDGYTLLLKAIAKLPRYTERECRNIFRQIVCQVEEFHRAGLAHRFLHTESFVVAEGVRSMLGTESGVARNFSSFVPTLHLAQIGAMHLTSEARREGPECACARDQLRTTVHA
jgi:serine/threonine protein kinase